MSTPKVFLLALSRSLGCVLTDLCPTILYSRASTVAQFLLLCLYRQRLATAGARNSTSRNGWRRSILLIAFIGNKGWLVRQRALIEARKFCFGLSSILMIYRRSRLINRGFIAGLRHFPWCRWCAL
jgi:hypothetical protein